MSIKLVKAEILRFLSSSKPEIICISGKWGVGKTYAWKQYLKEAAKGGVVFKDYKTYAYVSLFGQNSLQELKNSIFPSTVNINELEEGPDIKTYNGRVKNWRKLLPAIFNIVKDKVSINGIEQLFLLLVKKQIICFDDIERHGEGLNVKDVLGLASYLKEEKKCKVIIVLNDEMLEKTDKEVFNGQLEKVVDVLLRFKPNPEEAAEIGINKSTSFHKELADDSIKLGIINIRVIGKIQRLALLLEQKLKKFDPRIFKAALRSLILLGWAEYQPKEAPTIEFIKDNHRFYSAWLDKNNKVSEEESKWGAIMSSFGWTHFDEFDLEILNGIKNGYFDDVKLDEEAAKSEKTIKASDQDNSVNEAWGLYHGSFDDNEQAVLEAIYNASMKNANNINPSNLDSTVRFLKEFGKNTEAKNLIEKYLEARPGDRKIYNLRDYAFREDVQDPDVIAAFNKKFAEFEDKRDPLGILTDIVKKHGWNPEDIELLSKLSSEDFYKIFKEAKGDNRDIYVRGALTFSSIRDIGEKEKQISEKAKEALKKIGSENQINKRRVGLYGIKIE